MVNYLAVYKKNKPTDCWQLSSKIITSLDFAQQCSKKLIKTAKQNGFDFAEVSIQSFTNLHNIPETLHEVKPEKLLLN